MKALIALDHMPHSRRAAEYAAEVLPGLPGSEAILLALALDVAGGSQELDPQAEPPEVHGDEDHRRELETLRATLDEAAVLLQERGLSAGRVQTRIKAVHISVGQDIVDEAHACGCDTIILGRRGLSRFREMLQGSVSADVIHKAEGLTVWVVE